MMVATDDDRPDGRLRRGDKTAERLTTAARRIFSEKGFANTSVRAVAAAARCNPALVSYHFGSKEGLYNEVLEQAVGALRKRLVGAVETAGSPLERAQRAVRTYLEYLLENREFLRLVQRGLLDGDERVIAVSTDYIRPIVGRLRSVFGERELSQLTQVFVSVFGAVLVPFLYDPLVSRVFERDLMSPQALDERRRHLDRLVALLMERIDDVVGDDT